MSDYGFIAFDDQGHLQADDTLLLYYVRKTGTVTVQSSAGFGAANGINLNIGATYTSAIIGFSGSNGYLIGYDLNGAWSAGVFRFLTDAPNGTVFNYYVLETGDKVPPAPSGAIVNEAYDGSGNVTFTDSQYFAGVLNIYGSNFPSGTTHYSGRTLGFAPLCFAGHNRYADPDSGDTSSYHHDFAVAGGGINSAGTDATYGDIVVELGDIVGTRPPDSNQFEMNSSFFVLDFTNVPLGQTFF